MIQIEKCHLKVSLNLKIYFDINSDGFYYYPFIKYFAELTINPSFDPDVIDLKKSPLDFFPPSSDKNLP